MTSTPKHEALPDDIRKVRTLLNRKIERDFTWLCILLVLFGFTLYVPQLQSLEPYWTLVIGAGIVLVGGHVMILARRDAEAGESLNPAEEADRPWMYRTVAHLWSNSGLKEESGAAYDASPVDRRHRPAAISAWVGMIRVAIAALGQMIMGRHDK
ncbi:MAG TPA: hypothetical protein VEI03_12700 [Stellaceae bacterium]|nr:hypothetical protein [Stellaceae bacterium]